MRKRTKFTLAGIVLATGLFAVVGCTKSFCSNVDTARMLYAFDSGVTSYETGTFSETVSTATGKTYTVKNFQRTIATWDGVNSEFKFSEDKKLTYLNEINKSARDNGYLSINNNHLEYYATIDNVLFTNALKEALLDSEEHDIVVDLSTEEGKAKLDRDLSYYSYLKYVENNDADVWDQWDKVDAAVKNTLGIDKCPGSDFTKLYKRSMNNYVAQYRTCLTTKTDKYGSYGYSADGVFIESKSWGYAWSKGFFEGLLVYPIGWLIDQIAFGFRNANVAAGWSALLAILFVTLIIRSLMMLATIRQTASNAKMTELQPEITKIQNKYPNSNTSSVERQRMGQEMNALYKKNKINPFMAIIVMIIQFPVFICVWGALSGSAVLSSGTVLGLDLSLTIRQVLFTGSNWGPEGNYAAVTALFLFLFMAVSQAVAMLLPQWMQKARAKKVAKLGKNPAQKSQNNKMKWFTYIMLAMIIFMGFSLVSAMGVYWFVGALISIGQTLIMQYITARKKAKK